VYRLSWKIQLRSWDGFQIPLPFSRCEIRLGDAIRVPRDATDAQRETARRQLQDTLLSITPD
jgi:lysophospholipid acyltransferase (LPLAT)-like uncharacterized protein